MRSSVAREIDDPLRLAKLFSAAVFSGAVLSAASVGIEREDGTVSYGDFVRSRPRRASCRAKSCSRARVRGRGQGRVVVVAESSPVLLRTMPGCLPFTSIDCSKASSSAPLASIFRNRFRPKNKSRSAILWRSTTKTRRWKPQGTSICNLSSPRTTAAMASSSRHRGRSEPHGDGGSAA